MEPRRDLELIMLKYEPPLDQGALIYFEKALIFTKKFYQKELDQISSIKFEDLHPNKFFQETIWVIHATGFSAKVVGKFFDRLISAYIAHDDFIDLAKENKKDVIARVRKVVNNPQKIIAIHQIAKNLLKGIGTIGWDEYKNRNLSSPDLLKKLPYIGKITCFHLARNIGLLENVKPDLHLVRLAKHWNYKDCLSMCEEIQKQHELISGEKLPLGIIDLAIWYSASTYGSIQIRKEGDR